MELAVAAASVTLGALLAAAPRRAQQEEAELRRAAQDGRTAELDALVTQRGLHVDAPGESGETALMLSSLRANVPAARCLLKLRADATAIDERGRTALHAAARSGVGTAVELLLGHGALESEETTALAQEARREVQSARRPDMIVRVHATAQRHAAEWARRIRYLQPLAAGLLVCGADPGGVRPSALLREQVENHSVIQWALTDLRGAHDALAAGGGAVLHAGRVLDAAACAALRKAIDEQVGNPPPPAR